MSRFGVQPARALIAAERLTVRWVADEFTIPYAHAVNALSGRTVPSPELREGLSSFFGVSADELFTTESLAGSYRRPVTW